LRLTVLSAVKVLDGGENYGISNHHRLSSILSATGKSIAPTEPLTKITKYQVKTICIKNGLQKENLQRW
jgi:hypothetical protein